MGAREVKRVVDAIEALGKMSDTLQRAKDLTTLLDDWPHHHSRVRALRQDAVRALVAEGMTQKQVSEALHISPQRVSQILEGVTNPRTQKNPPPKRAKKATVQPPPEGTDRG